MFLLKTAFWLTLVAIAVPRIADSGSLDQATEDGISSSITAALPKAAALALGSLPVSLELPAGLTPRDCGHKAACVTGAALIDQLETVASAGLARARIEIRAQRAREMRDAQS